MEFPGYPRLCIALILLLCACYHVSSQPADSACQPTDDANKMMDMIYRQLRDTGSMMTDIKTLIMLQMQHSRDVTKANSDLQSQYSSAMAGMTETLAAMNSQISSLAQQQNESLAAMNSHISSLAHGQGWIVIQRRVDGAYFSNRSWEDYKLGFGDLAGSFWLGLEHMHRLTTHHRAILRVELEDWNGNSAWAQYASFRLEGEDGNYKLHLGKYSGTATDSLRYSDGEMFTTVDNDNDRSSRNCAVNHGGAGWWYGRCTNSSLNGKYVPGGAIDWRHGIYWISSKFSRYSLKKAEMKVFITP